MTVSRAEAQIIKDPLGHRPDDKGRAIVDPEILTDLVVRRRDTGGRGYIQLLQLWAGGVGAQTGIPHHRPGRMYQPGKHEMVVGAEAPASFWAWA